MNLPYIEHLGIIVKNIERALPFLEGVLGLTRYNIEEVANQKVRIAFLETGEIKLELLEPTSDESPTVKSIEKRGESIHHPALSSDDVAPVLEKLKGRGIRLIDEKSRKDAEGLNTAFVRSKGARGTLLKTCDCRDVAK